MSDQEKPTKGVSELSDSQAEGIEDPEKRPVSIVVVDDEEVVRQVILRHLEMGGLKATPFSNFEDAKTCVLDPTFPIDLLVTDQMLGGPHTGLDLIRLSKTLDFRDGIKTILTSGHTLQNILSNAGADAVGINALNDVDYFLQKPSQIQEIYKVAAELLRETEAFVRHFRVRNYKAQLETSQEAILKVMRELDYEVSYPPICDDMHPAPREEFLEQSSDLLKQPYLNSNPNWETGRSIQDIERMWSLRVIDLLALHHHFVKQHMPSDIVSAEYAQQCEQEKRDPLDAYALIGDLGVGAGETLRTLVDAGFPEESLVGITNSVFFELKSLLDNALKEEYASSTKKGKRKKNTQMHHFIRDFSAIFLNAKGMEGRLKIQLGNPTDEQRLKRLLFTLDVSGILEEPTIRYPDRFSEEIAKKVSPPSLALFAEYMEDPVTFFKKYFHQDLFNGEGKGLQKLANLPENDAIIQSDFADLDSRLSQKTMLAAGLDCRSFSHLPDAQFQNAVLACLARLHPGGCLLFDGLEESYSTHDRIGEIVRIQEYLKSIGRDEEFQFDIISNNKTFVIYARRGVKKEDGTFQFVSKSGIRQALHKDTQMVPVNQYVKTWPERSFRNVFIKRVRQAVWKQVKKEIYTKKKPFDYVLYWLSDRFAPLLEKINLAVEESLKTQEWDDLKRDFRGGFQPIKNLAEQEAKVFIDEAVEMEISPEQAPV